MHFIRFGLPAVIILAGVVLAIAVGTDSAWQGGALLVSAGLSVWLINVLFRLGVRGDSDRAREQRAREEFDRTGRWADEDADDLPGPEADDSLRGGTS